MSERQAIHICPDPNEHLHDFGEKRVQSALEIVGSSFLQNPYAVRHPLYFGNGAFVHAQSENGVLSTGEVYLAAQGPLPIEVRGKEALSVISVFGIEGLPEGHEAACLVSPKRPASEKSKMYVVVRDHVHMISQQNGGGRAWDLLDNSLVDVFNNGGAILLLPECASQWSTERMESAGKRAASMIGIDKVSVQPQFGYESVPNRELLKQANKEALKNAVVTKCEYVILPWSDIPFTHIEIMDRKRPGDIHHVWAYGPVMGMGSVPFRPHSACDSSQIFGANNCDCPEQYDAAFQKVVSEGFGMVMYLDQEARGHGAIAKVGTWGLNIGHHVDLIQAFHAGGYTEDCREFNVVAEVIEWLRIKSVVLLSNNVSVKQNGLIDAGVTIAGRMSVMPEPRSEACRIDHHAKVHKRGDDMDPTNAIPLEKNILRHH